MDNLTHTATGLFLGRAGLGRRVPYAPAILMLAANAPDIDVISLAGGPLGYLNWHRHFTHALAALPFMALLPVLVVRLFARKPFRWLPALGIALAGAASHLALDYANVYGLRLLLPFSGGWYLGNTISVVDLWIWSAFLIALAAPFLARLVGSEIGGRKTAAPGRAWARLALVFLALYGGGRMVLRERALATIESRLYEGSRPLRAAALPTPANPFVWRGVVETADFYALLELNLLSDFDPTQARVYHKPEASPALEAARRTRVFQDFLRFSQYPLWRVIPVPEPEDGVRVEAMDLRFGAPGRPGFMATAILNARLEPVRVWFEFARAGPR